ncbi:hypothetical protein LPJ81_003464 [Coemansia sp. IMI 209127]|nr:hypothetical protein LPJ81_003464 [Coemansia sp. IMI 209127]
MSGLATVSDCSSVQYCTQSNQALNYESQYIVSWNNQLSPLNSQSMVTVSVYSTYDLTTPIYTQTNIDNANGQISLQPDATWFSRYTGSDDSVGEDQTIYFAVYLQGNDPPAASSMLQLRLTATPTQYQQIQQILQADASASSASLASLLSSSTASAVSSSSTTGSSSMTLGSSDSLQLEVVSGVTRTETITEADTVSESNGKKDGLSDGVIAGIVVASVVGFLFLLFLLLLPLYLRRRRSKRLLTKTGGGGGGDNGAGADAESALSEPRDDDVPAMAAPVPARHTSDEKQQRQHLDTPLLLGNRPNNSSSFTSQDDGSTYQPLSLESPRVLMHMPSSTRSAGVNPEAGLSTDDARQIGDSFRDAMRRPPPISDEDDDVEEDPGWRERVANERMQRELEQEASVIRSVAMRAQGSGDLSSSISSPPPPPSAP